MTNYTLSLIHIYIADYKVTSLLEKEHYKEGIFELEVAVGGTASGTSSIAYTLKDASDKTVLEGSRKLESHGSGNLIVFDEQRLPDAVSYTHLDVYKRQRNIPV